MTSITINVKHRVRTVGSEHQGRTSISDPDQNLGFPCIFSSGMQEIYILFANRIKNNLNILSAAHCVNTAMQYAEILKNVKMIIFDEKKGYIFLNLLKT